MMKRMDAAQDPIALGAETVSHKGLWVDDAALKAVAVPDLVIYGGNDRPAFFESAKSRFPNFQFKKIEGVGHGPAMQSPEFPKDIREFSRPTNAQTSGAGSEGALMARLETKEIFSRLGSPNS